MNLNIVHLVGRAGKDPEVRYLESGAVLCKLTMAVNRRTKKTDQPDWFNLEMWDKTAEVAANYIRKGSLIGIQGSLKIDTWSDRTTGANRSTPVIRVNRLDLLGSRKDNENEAMNSYEEDEF